MYVCLCVCVCVPECVRARVCIKYAKLLTLKRNIYMQVHTDHIHICVFVSNLKMSRVNRGISPKNCM